jgi:hypothetical protein
LPLLWASGVGAATMRRIAAPVVGGLFTAMVLALIVVPVVYTLWREWQLKRGLFPRVVPEGGRAEGGLPEAARPRPAGT